MKRLCPQRRRDFAFRKEEESKKIFLQSGKMPIMACPKSAKALVPHRGPGASGNRCRMIPGTLDPGGDACLPSRAQDHTDVDNGYFGVTRVDR